MARRSHVLVALTIIENCVAMLGSVIRVKNFGAALERRVVAQRRIDDERDGSCEKLRGRGERLLLACGRFVGAPAVDKRVVCYAGRQ